jgi:hypothetical protein
MQLQKLTRVTQLVESLFPMHILSKKELGHIYKAHFMTKIYGMNHGNRGEASKLTCKICQKLCTALLLYSSKTSFMYLHQQVFKYTKFIWYHFNKRNWSQNRKISYVLKCWWQWSLIIITYATKYAKVNENSVTEIRTECNHSFYLILLNKKQWYNPIPQIITGAENIVFLCYQRNGTFSVCTNHFSTVGNNT